MHDQKTQSSLFLEQISSMREHKRRQERPLKNRITECVTDSSSDKAWALVLSRGELSIKWKVGLDGIFEGL